MTRHDWYRAPDWDEPAKAAFEGRLGRSRAHSRPQYLRIKALALLESDDQTVRADGRHLLQRIIDDHPASLDVAFAHELLARSLAFEGDRASAKVHLRECIRVAGPSRNGTTGAPDVLLIELLVDDGELDEADRRWPEAERVAGQRLGQMPAADFEFHRTMAKLMTALGQPERAAAAARRAIEDAAKTRSGFAKHPHIGLVQTDDGAFAELRRMAGD